MRDVRANLLLDKILGVELHIVDIKPGETEDGRGAEADPFRWSAERAAELNASGHPCLGDIPMGGASGLVRLDLPRWFCGIETKLEETGIQSRLYFSCDWKTAEP